MSRYFIKAKFADMSRFKFVDLVNGNLTNRVINASYFEDESMAHQVLNKLRLDNSEVTFKLEERSEPVLVASKRYDRGDN